MGEDSAASDATAGVGCLRLLLVLGLLVLLLFTPVWRAKGLIPPSSPGPTGFSAATCCCAACGMVLLVGGLLRMAEAGMLLGL